MTTTFDASYNGRTPTVPTQTMNVDVVFRACQRYAEDSDHDRGFLFLYQFDCKYAPSIQRPGYPAVHRTPNGASDTQSQTLEWVPEEPFGVLTGICRMARLNYKVRGI